MTMCAAQGCPPSFCVLSELSASVPACLDREGPEHSESRVLRQQSALRRTKLPSEEYMLARKTISDFGTGLTIRNLCQICLNAILT